MSGFDNGTLQQGVFAQTKRFGSVLRGIGDPAPQAGVVGDFYLDTQSWLLFARRADNKTSPWGNWLFQVPVTYQATLKWFSTSQPDNTVGVNGDYCLLWGAFGNYGVQPSILGPKAAGAWPTVPVAVAVVINPLYTAENEHNI